MLGRETGNYGGAWSGRHRYWRRSWVRRRICTAMPDGASCRRQFSQPGKATNSLVAAIKREGGNAIAIAGDVANAGSVERMVQYVEQALGPATILVNNAALTDVHKPWQEIDEAEWAAVMAVNLKSCFLCFRAVYPAMRAVTWGRVVNISSVTFWLGRPHLVCMSSPSWQPAAA